MFLQMSKQQQQHSHGRTICKSDFAQQQKTRFDLAQASKLKSSSTWAVATGFCV